MTTITIILDSKEKSTVTKGDARFLFSYDNTKILFKNESKRESYILTYLTV